MEEHISNGISPEYDSRNKWNTTPSYQESDSNNLESIGRAKRDSLKETVLEIGKLIKERDSLSGNFIAEGEKMRRDTTICSMLSLWINANYRIPQL